jgi:hypothetical protein
LIRGRITAESAFLAAMNMSPDVSGPGFRVAAASYYWWVYGKEWDGTTKAFSAAKRCHAAFKKSLLSVAAKKEAEDKAASSAKKRSDAVAASRTASAALAKVRSDVFEASSVAQREKSQKAKERCKKDRSDAGVAARTAV